MKTILLKFSGPLQSWGTSSHFETRETDYYPSKSAIIGLIAAAFGFRRNEDTHISRFNELDFAVRIDQPGNLLRDYHTVQKYKDNGIVDRTYVTNRYYLEDAVFVVFLSHQDDQLIEDISQVLQTPYFQTFLGRRSLPLNADFYLGVENNNLISSLKELPWMAQNWYKKKHNHLSFLVAFGDANLFEGTNRIARKDRVISFNQKHRQFGYRYESRIEVPIIHSEKLSQHDVYAAVEKG